MKIVIVVLVVITVIFALGIGVGLNQPDTMTEEEIPEWIRDGLWGLFEGFQKELDLSRIKGNGNNGQYLLDEKSRKMTLYDDTLNLTIDAVDEKRGLECTGLKLLSGPQIRVLYIDADSEKKPDPGDEDNWSILSRIGENRELRIAVRNGGGELKLHKLGMNKESIIAFE